LTDQEISATEGANLFQRATGIELFHHALQQSKGDEDRFIALECFNLFDNCALCSEHDCKMCFDGYALANVTDSSGKPR